MIKSKLSFALPGEIRLGGYGGEMTEYILQNQLLDADTWALVVDQFRRREGGTNGGAIDRAVLPFLYEGRFVLFRHDIHSFA